MGEISLLTYIDISIKNIEFVEVKRFSFKDDDKEDVFHLYMKLKNGEIYEHEYEWKIARYVIEPLKESDKIFYYEWQESLNLNKEQVDLLQPCCIHSFFVLLDNIKYYQNETLYFYNDVGLLGDHICKDSEMIRKYKSQIEKAVLNKKLSNRTLLNLLLFKVITQRDKRIFGTALSRFTKDAVSLYKLLKNKVITKADKGIFEKIIKFLCEHGYTIGNVSLIDKIHSEGDLTDLI